MTDAAPAAWQRHPAALTIDLEDYFHPELIRRHGGLSTRSPRADVSTAPILELLKEHGVLATFFIVGEVVEQFPDLIRRIADAGHELACHTFTHKPLWDLTPEEFRGELRDFRQAMKQAVGEAPIRGFRAPTFSLDASTQWALRVLEEEGYTYDSSLVPIRGPLYGCPGAPWALYRPSRDDLRRDDAAGALVEFPAPVTRLAGKAVPVGGGFYLRTMPFWLYHRLVRKVLEQRPFFLYLHPWETDPGVPRARLPTLARWATYTGIGQTLKKLELLLRSIRFTTMKAAFDEAGLRV